MTDLLGAGPHSALSIRHLVSSLLREQSNSSDEVILCTYIVTPWPGQGFMLAGGSQTLKSD